MSGEKASSGLHRYKKLRVIGSGTYGKVYKVRCLDDDQQYVMKRVTLAQNSEADKKQALLEVEVLSALKHPHIVPYKECFWDEDEMDLCMVMDYCEGGDLYHYVQSRRKQGRKIEEDEAWLFMIQMMFALAYLHAKKILHRDVKSQNIFLSKGKCQLGDFGLAKKLEESFELARTPIGTPFYMAPEIMEGRPYAFKSDVWALGCVMYEVLTGKPAFAAKNFPGVAMKVLSGNYEPISEDYSQELRDVVSKMLCSNVNARPFIFQLIETPAIMHRAHSYLSDLETEHIQSGMLGTWRGAIPIVTAPASHLPGILESSQEGSTFSPSTSSASLNKTADGQGKEDNKAPAAELRPGTSGDGQPPSGTGGAPPGDDIDGSSSLMAPWREGQEGEEALAADGTEAEPVDSSLSEMQQAYVEAAAMSSSEDMPGSGPVTLPRDTLHLSALDLSISSTNPPGGLQVYSGAASRHTLMGTNARRRPQSAAPNYASGGSGRTAYTLPHAASPMQASATLERPPADEGAGPEPEPAGGSVDLASEGEEPEAAVPANPPEELTEGQQALNEDERHALRNQLEQLQVISECVRQAGISENSGELSVPSEIADAAVWQEVADGLRDAVGEKAPSSRPPSSRPASRQPQPPISSRPPSQQSQQRGSPGAEELDDASYYSSDFEEDEEEMEARRKQAQWQEQQRRRAVQKQWNSEGAEDVPDDLSIPVDLTPRELSSDDEGGREDGAEDDRDSVEEEPITAEHSAVRINRIEAQKTAAQQRLAERERKLRQRCIQGLGEATYHRLYDFLSKRAKLFSEDDDLALRIELSAFLEESQMAYWPLVDELVYFDQTGDNE